MAQTDPLLDSCGCKDEVSSFMPNQYYGIENPNANIEYKRSISDANDELWQFRLGLLWLGLEQLTVTHVLLSWTLFLLFTLLIPLFGVFYVVCHNCEESQKHHFQLLVQMSESFLCVIGFLCLSVLLRTYGLRRMFFLEQIGKESAQVQQGYQAQLQDAFRLLVTVLLPCFIVEFIHKILWFTRASVDISVVRNRLTKNVSMCILMMMAWLYRAAVFMLMCVLFRLMCCLQILRFKGFYKLLESTPHCSVILKEHMRIRDQLIVMSHRFRIFLLSSLITITLSQIASLFIITARSRTVSFAEVGDLAVCSVTQLIGLVVCLHGAAKITHSAQRIVSFVSRWHAVASCVEPSSNSAEHGLSPILHVESQEDLEAASNSTNEGHGQRPAIKSTARSYFKRQALVAYFQHCKGSVTIYGFVVDRGSIYAIFMLELSLLLWTLGKTVLVGPQQP